MRHEPCRRFSWRALGPWNRGIKAARDREECCRRRCPGVGAEGHFRQKGRCRRDQEGLGRTAGQKNPPAGLQKGRHRLRGRVERALTRAGEGRSGEAARDAPPFGEGGREGAPPRRAAWPHPTFRPACLPPAACARPRSASCPAVAGRRAAISAGSQPVTQGTGFPVRPRSPPGRRAARAWKGGAACGGSGWAAGLRRRAPWRGRRSLCVICAKARRGGFPRLRMRRHMERGAPVRCGPGPPPSSSAAAAVTAGLECRALPSWGARRGRVFP